jgi:DNA gyrase subunit A
LGQAYQIKVHQLPMGSATARGRPLISLFPVSEGESLATLLPLNQGSDDNPYIVFATSKGSVRKNALSDFLDIRSNGKIAMKLDDGEQLVAVHLANDTCDVLLSSHGGKSIRFPVASLRQFNSRSSTGVRGMTLKPDDMVVAMNIVQSRSYSPDMIALYRKKKYQDDDAPDLSDGMLSKEDMASMAADEEFFLTISKGGFGKRTSSYAYRCSNRGGQGVATMDTTVRTGHIVDVMPVRDDDHVLLLTDKGQLLRCPVKDIRIAGRKTKGVKLFRLQNDESITSVAVLPADTEQEADPDPSLPLADGQ